MAIQYGLLICGYLYGTTIQNFSLLNYELNLRLLKKLIPCTITTNFIRQAKALKQRSS